MAHGWAKHRFLWPRSKCGDAMRQRIRRSNRSGLWHWGDYAIYCEGWQNRATLACNLLIISKSTVQDRRKIELLSCTKGATEGYFAGIRRVIGAEKPSFLCTGNSVGRNKNSVGRNNNSVGRNNNSVGENNSRRLGLLMARRLHRHTQTFRSEKPQKGNPAL